MSTYLNESRAHGPSAYSRSSEIQLMDANFIILFGCTGTGKTSFANVASGNEMQVGRGLQSLTKNLEASKIFQVDGQSVVIVDCPGFNDTYLTETEVLRRHAEFLTIAYTSKKRVIGFLYFHNISDTRVGGKSLLDMNLFKALCGTGTLKNAVYVTNMWSEPPTEDEIIREMELRDTEGFFGGALANGAQMVRHHNTRDSAHEIIRILLGKEPVITKLQRQLVDEKTPLEKTDAGLVIGEDLEDKLRKKHEEMDELNTEKEKALESNNQNWLRRLEAQEKLARVKGQELIKQLHVLKASKGRQSETTSPQCYHNQGGVISPGLPSRFRPQEEAKTNEPTQNAILQIMPSDPCLSGQQEWENWKNDRVAREIARIESESAYLRNHTSTRGPLRFLVDAAVAFGSTLGQIVHLEFGSPSSVAVDSHHSRGHPSPTHESSSQNERTSFRSSQPVCTPGIEDMESRHGPNDDSQCWRQSDGLGSIHDELKGCAATSRKQN